MNNQIISRVEVSPTVSVIMNCYNGEKYLKEAIDSVYAQTYQNWEIIFWDNCSNDRSADIAQSYNDKLKYFRSNENTSLGEARNFAIAKASGQYIAILDCDDVYFPNKLELQASLLDEDQKLGLIYSNCLFVDADGKTIGVHFDRVRPVRGDIYKSLLLRPNFIPCPSVMLRKSAIDKVGSLDKNLSYSEEYDLFLRMSKEYTFTYIDDPIVKYRLHDSNMAGKGVLAMTLETIEVIKRATKNDSQLSAGDRLCVLARLSCLYAKLAYQYITEQ